MTTTTKILTTVQAQAVYSAMCALNQIGAVVDVDIPDDVNRIRSVRVLGTFAGGVQVEQLWDDRKRELYADPAAFAAAYGLRAAPVVSTLVDELSRIGEVRQGDAVLTRDAAGYHMRHARSLLGCFRHDLPTDTTDERLEAHWAGFVANVRAA